MWVNNPVLSLVASAGLLNDGIKSTHSLSDIKQFIAFASKVHTFKHNTNYPIQKPWPYIYMRGYNLIITKCVVRNHHIYTCSVDGVNLLCIICVIICSLCTL